MPTYLNGFIIFSPDELVVGEYYLFTDKNGPRRGKFMGIEQGGLLVADFGGAGTGLYDPTKSRVALPYKHDSMPALLPVPDRETLPYRNIPRGSTNQITMNTITNDQVLENFHGEYGYGRYYTEGTVAQFNPRTNPMNRTKFINPENITYYKARLTNTAAIGGKKRKTKKTRKAKKTRRQGRK